MVTTYTLATAQTQILRLHASVSAEDVTWGLALQDGSGSQGSGMLPTQGSFTRVWDREKDKEGPFGGGQGQPTAHGPALPGMTNEGPRAANALASWRARRGCQLDITNLPGTEFLTTQVRAAGLAPI